MSVFRALAAGLRRLLARDRANQDLADEIDHFVAAATAEYVRQGLSPTDAARRAAADVGSRAAVAEEVRQGGWEHLVEATTRDVVLAIRALRRAPGFTIISTLTLALGLGATTAIFSVVNPLLFEQLPYPGSGRLMLIADRGGSHDRAPVTFGTFTEISARSHAFESLSAIDAWQPVLGDVTEPVRVEGQRVTSDYFHVLGVLPAIGRDFNRDDDQPNAARVVILSDQALQRHFGGDRGLLGRPITLNGFSYLVIGIMPRGFSTALAPDAEFWTTAKYRSPAPFQGPEWGHHMTMVGRLRAGITTQAAQAELDTLARSPSPAFPRPRWADLAAGLIAAPLRDEVTREIRPALGAVFGAVLLVLTVAIVNVTNLLLARGAKRRAEFAMRAALGASRGRLVRQLLTESLVLSLVGGVLALGVAVAGVKGFVALSPPSWAALNLVRIDIGAFAFAVLVTLVTGVGVGMIPALEASARGRTASGIGASSLRTTSRHVTRRTLVVSEVALAVVLLTGAGLLWRSVAGLLAIPPGFDSAHVLSLRLQVVGQASDDVRRERFSDIAAAIRAVPGVTAVGTTSQLPLSGDFDAYGAFFASVPNASPDGDDAALRYEVAGDYFKAMHIPLLRGRLLDERDRVGSSEAILISDSYAKRKFSGVDPIGQRVKFGPETIDPARPWDTIVGVVGDVKQTSLGLAQPDAFYVAMGQWSWVDAIESFVIQTSGDPSAIAPSVRNAIRAVDPARAIEHLRPLSDLVVESESQRIFVMRIFEAFAAVTLLLAAIGLYGVLSGNVTERTREIGVRAALGASRGELLALVARDAARMTTAGVALGVVAALGASRTIATLLFGISRFDPWTYVAIIATLSVVAAAACAVPAWRAARIDPMCALRAD